MLSETFDQTEFVMIIIFLLVKLFSMLMFIELSPTTLLPMDVTFWAVWEIRFL